MRYPFLKYSLATLLLLVQFVGITFAQDVMPRPEGAQHLVYDYAGFLTEEQDQELNTILENFALETSNQILFISVNSLNDIQPYEYAERILTTWGIGQKDMNNGIVILIKPKTPDSRGEVFIASGYGLEGAIPDATAALIVQNEMIPEFKAGNNYTGILRAVDTLMALAKGEINSGEYQSRTSGKEEGWFPVFIFLLIMFFIFIGRAARAKRYASTNNLAFWTAFWLLSNTGRSHGGSWGGFSGGGGGGFGGGGGGFGGFGGGMGGGGGAGGSW